MTYYSVMHLRVRHPFILSRGPNIIRSPEHRFSVLGGKNAKGTQRIRGVACLDTMSSLVPQQNWKTEVPAGEIWRGTGSRVAGSAGER